MKRRHILPKALVVGLVAGIIASGFRLTLDHAEHFRESTIAGLAPWLAAVIAIGGGALAGGIGLWIVRRFAPEAAGSGIPHLKSVLHGETDMRWKSLLPLKFLAGVLSIGGGLSLGREGPTVQMGGAAPLTGIVLMVEMTGEYDFMLPLLISCLTAYGIAEAYRAPAIYEALCHRRPLVR